MGQKISHSSAFLILSRLFLKIFRFFLYPPDWLSLLRYYPRRGKQCIQYYWSTIQFSHIFCHCLFEFYSDFNFRHSRKSLYIRLEECSCCALKGDAVYTSIRIEESLIIDSYLESRQLKRVEILADWFCIISGWLTCLEALGLT